MHRPRVLMHPEASFRLKRGFDTMAGALATRLGPLHGTVLNVPLYGSQPEFLLDSASVAKRVSALADRGESVGAMMLRHVVQRVHQRVGDGGATAAVLAQAILHEATRYVAAGANAILVKRGIGRAAAAVGQALTDAAQPVQGEDEYSVIAEAVTGEPRLSLILGEIYDLLGQYPFVILEKYGARSLDRMYLNGGRWQARLISPYLITLPPARRAIQSNCWVAIFQGRIKEVSELSRLLQLVKAQEFPQLLLAAHAINPEVLNTIVAVHQEGKSKFVAVELWRPEAKRRSDFDDLALLTGAEVLSQEADRPLREITARDLGFARRIEASKEELIVAGGNGDRDRIRERIEILQQRTKTLEVIDDEWSELQMRLARLSGTAAVLNVGAPTPAERDVLYLKAEKGLKALNVAVRDGVLTGGGIAYIECTPSLDNLSSDGDEKLGVQAVARALSAPFFRILLNAGVDAPGPILGDLQRRGSGYTYDVSRREIVHGFQTGLLDAATVLRAALETAASGAAQALTTDTIVLHRMPPKSTAS